MKSSIYLGAVVVILGALLFTLANEGASTDITINGGPRSIKAGEAMGGIASQDGAEWVKVRIYLDGELIEEDELMEGELNEFGVDIPADAAGKTLRIEVETSRGGYRERSYPVN